VSVDFDKPYRYSKGEPYDHRGLPNIKIQLWEKTGWEDKKALFDSGADCSFFGLRIMDRLDTDGYPRKNVELTGVDGRKFPGKKVVVMCQIPELSVPEHTCLFWFDVNYPDEGKLRTDHPELLNNKEILDSILIGRRGFLDNVGVVLDTFKSYLFINNK